MKKKTNYNYYYVSEQYSHKCNTIQHIKKKEKNGREKNVVTDSFFNKSEIIVASISSIQAGL